MLFIFLIALSLYVAAFLLLASMQRSLMYHPERGSEAHFLERAKTQNLQPWRDENGELIGWKRVKNASREHRVLDVGKDRVRVPQRLLILHGNGGSALSRTYLMDGFDALDDTDWEFYALEYPGYAWRDGEHTETEIVAASQSALLQLAQNDSRPVFVAGESLGSGVACLLAARHPDKIAGLLLVTPFTSAVDVAQNRFPIFPVALALRDRYDAARALQQYRGRVAVLLAGKDENVPAHIGHKLFDSYHGAKKLWIQPAAGHNTLNYDEELKMWREVSNFLSDIG